MLLETLIALLIFAIGVLGLIGMQAAAMKVSAESKYRAEATMFADQLINQMWSDDRTNATLKTNYEGTNGSGGPKYNAWYASIIATGTGLPGANASPNRPTVVIDANNKMTITLRWMAPGETVGHRHVTVAQVNN